MSSVPVEAKELGALILQWQDEAKIARGNGRRDGYAEQCERTVAALHELVRRRRHVPMAPLPNIDCGAPACPWCSEVYKEDRLIEAHRTDPADYPRTTEECGCGTRKVWNDRDGQFECPHCS